MHPDKITLKYLLLSIALVVIFGIIPLYYANSVDITLVDAHEKIWIARVISVVSLFSVLIWFIKSIRKVSPEYIGCVIEFGKPRYQINPGLHFIPCLSCELRLLTKLAIEEQIPEDYKNGSINITHGSTTLPTGDPLDTRLTTSVNFKYRYKIIDTVSFIENIGSRYELKKQLQDLIVNKAMIECSKFTLAINLDRREQLNHLLREATIDFTRHWGVEILMVQLQEIDLGNEINKAQTNVSVSAINVASNKNNATKIYYDGAAEAEVHKMFQFAKAEGIKEIAKKLGVDDLTAIYQIETLANVWRKSNADLNLYGNDVQQLFGMLMTVYKEKGGDNSKKDD